MRQPDVDKLVRDAQNEVLRGTRRLAILNVSDVAIDILREIDARGLLGAVIGLYAISTAEVPAEVHGVAVRPLSALKTDQPEAIVVAADEDKEDIIAAALPHITGSPKLIVAGYGHYAFRDRMFEEISAQLLVPSLANGYKHSLVHLYQCLANGARLGLDGVVAEFGIFKGGTTMFIATALKRLGVHWPVIAFEIFSGFPPRRSPLDMYDDAGCVFRNRRAVEAYLAGENVEIVAGDIAETRQRLVQENLVVTFFDTDNYSATRAALEIVREQTVLNGAIVFDHFTGEERFRYTLGERFAGKTLLDDHRYLNLHGTGVFLRQR